MRKLASVSKVQPIQVKLTEPQHLYAAPFLLLVSGLTPKTSR